MKSAPTHVGGYGVTPALLSGAKRNSGNQLFSEAVLKSRQDSARVKRRDARQPHAGIHREEQSAFTNSRRLRVRGNSRIDQMVPHANDLGLGEPRIHPQLFANARAEGG